ncbi:MAG: hypothetical protein HOD64_00150 [Candidatus Cloacimonetes bacterium]|jgi:hypothetical protein|nr:hypothetical protein [Candidatus Cloacimonadota bacterium]MBT4331663.1 hypothetical protein [Candidatus Cloacimonadota bacterium]
MKLNINTNSLLKTFKIIFLVLFISISTMILLGIYVVSNSYEDNFIGSIEGNGQFYRSYNNLFTFRNVYSGSKRYYYKDWIGDRIDDIGYNLSFNRSGHSPFYLTIFSKIKTKDDFNRKALSVANSIDSLLTEPQFEFFEENNFHCIFQTILTPDNITVNTDSLLSKELSAALFCYNDSVSFLLRTSRTYKTTLVNNDFDKSIAKNERRLLLNYIKHNLEISDKFYKEGIPEPLSDYKVKGIINGKRIKRFLYNIFTLGKSNYKKQDRPIKRIKLK